MNDGANDFHDPGSLPAPSAAQGSLPLPAGRYTGHAGQQTDQLRCDLASAMTHLGCIVELTMRHRQFPQVRKIGRQFRNAKGPLWTLLQQVSGLPAADFPAASAAAAGPLPVQEENADLPEMAAKEGAEGDASNRPGDDHRNPERHLKDHSRFGVRPYKSRKPLRADYDTDEDYEAAFRRWRRDVDLNNERVRKFREKRK